MVPFHTEDELNQATKSCRRGQQGSTRRKEFRSSTAAPPKSDVREDESVVSTRAHTEIGTALAVPSAAEAGTRIPGLDSGAGPVKTVAGAPVMSPLGERLAKFPHYELEDISDPEEGPSAPLGSPL